MVQKNSIKDGVVGTLNVLRARGNLDEPLEAPTHVDLIDEVQLVLSSSSGIFVRRADADVSNRFQLVSWAQLLMCRMVIQLKILKSIGMVVFC